MPNSYRKRHERKAQIELVLAIKAEKGQPPEGTAYQIARLIDVVVSQHLYSILADMVAEHRLNVRDEEIVNRCTRTFYILPQETIEKLNTREITLRYKGQVIQEKLL